MRLTDFLRRDMDVVLTAWDEFARQQVPPSEIVEVAKLRDHAKQILAGIIEDLETQQIDSQQASKPVADSRPPGESMKTAAEAHGEARVVLGFEIEQVVAEFRALRASVLRRWTHACLPGATNAEDVMRFNEAIDQALTESVTVFSRKSSQERNLLLGTLGHDMRSPLHVIQASAAALAKLSGDKGGAAIVARIKQSGFYLKSLLDDLVDFNRIKLGRGLPVTPVQTDLAALFEDTLEQLRSANAHREVEFHVTENVEGTWDPQRVQQVLSNLVINAFKYGNPRSAVRVFLAGGTDDVEFRVVNQGPKINATLAKHIFDPLVRGARELQGADEVASLGLGLYIARQIVQSHGGNISLASSDQETAFSVRLPRSLGLRRDDIDAPAEPNPASNNHSKATA